MKEVDIFTTVKVESEGKFQSRGSKFYAYLFPMTDLTELEERIMFLKHEHIKARHFCYAYRILTGNEVSEYSSDAGEPGGSSGPPILGVLKHHELLNVGCVVVRHFGGTKLGIPGLIEAYGAATTAAVQSSRSVPNQRSIQVRLDAPMRFQPHLLEAAKRENLATKDLNYTSRFQMTLSIPVESKTLHLRRLLLHPE